MKTRIFLAGILIVLLSTLMFVYATSYPGDLTDKWISKGSIQPYTYTVEPYNSTFYGAINHTGYGTAATLGYEFLSSNAATVIQNCINTGTGNTILLRGAIALTSTVYVNQSHTTIKGTSKEYQTDIQTSVAGPAFFVGFSTGSTKVEYASIEDVMIRSTTRTAGRHGIQLQGCREVTIQDVTMRNLDVGIYIDTSQTDLSVRGNVQLNYITMENFVGYGIYSVGGETTGTIPELESTHIRMWGEDFATCPVSGIWAESLRGDFYNLEIDYTTSHAIYIQRPQQVKLNSLWIEYTGGYGVFYNSSASSTQAYTNWISSSSFIQNCNYSGVCWYRICDSHIEDTGFRNNGKLNVTGENDAIKLYSCQRITVLGNTMFDDSVSSKTQYYALSTNSTTDYTVVLGNHVQRNLGTISYVDTHIYGAHNDGFTFPAEVISESGVNPSSDIIVYPYDSTQYAALNASTNVIIEGPSTNLSDVVIDAFTHLTSGRNWQETLRLIGNCTLLSYIAVPSYTIFDMTNSHITIGASWGGNVITETHSGSESMKCLVTNADHAAGNKYIIIRGGWIDGNGDRQVNDTDNNWAGVWLDSCVNSTLQDLHVENIVYNIDIGRGGSPRAMCYLFTENTNIEVVNCEGYKAGYEVVGVRGGNTHIHFSGGWYMEACQHAMQTAKVLGDWSFSANDQIDIDGVKLSNGALPDTLHMDEGGYDHVDCYCCDADGYTWIHNAEFEGKESGVSGLRVLNSVTKVTFEDSNVTVTGTGTTHCVKLGTMGATAGGAITDIIVRNVRMTSQAAAILFENTVGESHPQSYSDIAIIGCTIQSTASFAVWCEQDATRISIQNNRVTVPNTYTAVKFEGGLDDSLVLANFVTSGTSGICFWIAKTNYTIFQNNVLTTGSSGGGFIEYGSCDYNAYVINNVVNVANATGRICNVTSTSIVANNLGYP